MNLILAKLSRYGWNKRVLTQADFYRICWRERIKVVEMPLQVPGFYMFCKGKAFIAINTTLRGIEWLKTAFHELAHHFLHVPAGYAAYFYGLAPNSKPEFEAEAYAVCALVPKELVETMTMAEIQEEYGYSHELLWQRKCIYE